LEHAITKENLADIRAILQANPKLLVSSVSGKDLLLLAAESANAEIIALLIANGANVHGKDADGRTALHVAVSNGKLGDCLAVSCRQGEKSR
jgi:ankyrin repeat protein